MPIDKIFEFICENCLVACIHSPIGFTIPEAIQHAEERGVIVKNGKKVFCNEKCLKEWKKKNGI